MSETSRWWLILKLWPMVAYGIVIWCNTDAIIPIGLGLGFSKQTLLLLVPLLATLEMCYGYWFWGWVVRGIPEIEKIQEARRELRKSGLLDRWILDKVVSTYRKVIHPENGTAQVLRYWGVAAVWVAGLNPIPGLPTRGPCAVFLGVFRRKREFYHLLIANFIHVVMMICGWSWLLGR